ncbi:MAG: TolC family protein [Prevotella sp.]|nr:TolC family protein [Bacteroides sp.]MCM1365753.1 TolC family protein [Prevotella sp.]MCM1436423.1 TolC family protein [Prevotella sp.]
MKKLTLLVLAASLGAASLSAQTVSLDSCRRMALHNNKVLKIADETILGAQYDRKAAKAAYLPGIDFSAGYMYNQNKISLLGADAHLPTMTFDPLSQQYVYNVMMGSDMKPVIDPQTGLPVFSEVAVIPKEAMTYDVHNVVAGAFTLTQPVFMGGQIKALNEITRYAEELAKSSRNAAAQDVIFAVDGAYWQVVSLKEKKKLAESFVQLVDSLYINVQLMEREGMSTKSDVLTVAVSLNEANIMLTKVDNGLSLSRMALAQICGLPVNTQMELQDEDLRRTSKTAPAVSYNIEDVYARRQDLSMLRQGISLFEQKEKLALSTMLPKIAIVGAWSFSNPNVIDGFKKRFGGGFSIGATLTVPLWHWGGNYNQLKSARSATARQRLLLEDAEEKVQLQVSQAKYSYEEAYKTYAMTVKNLEKADENLRQAKLAFREGVMTADDVLTAQTAWRAAHSEKIDAEIGIHLTTVYLSKVLGTLDY